MKKLQNKVAVITGGNSGIGLATAKAFINAGAEVWITGRNAENLQNAGGVAASDPYGDRYSNCRIKLFECRFSCN